MPGVSVLPMSSALGTFGSPPHSATTNGFGRSSNDMAVADIKEKAKEDARRNSRGASALSLVGAARVQALHGRDCEASGDLAAALAAFTKAASLVHICMSSAEFKAESQPGKKGVLYKEVTDFQKHEGYGIPERVESLETKLAELEKAASTPNDTPIGDGPVRKTGGSIADRMRSLQDAGLSVSTTKRFSREISPLPPTPPLSPETHRSHRFSTPLSTPLLPISPIAPSPHALVPTSAFGPPSPSSSTSSSPRGTHFTLSEFSQAFPSIDELDEVEGLKLPSIPTGPSTNSNLGRGPAPSGRHVISTPSKNPSPPSVRTFPVLPVDPGPRPSSTPITPTINTFISRPGSPTRSPISPTIVPKPSSLGLSSISAPPERPLKNVIEPKELHELMYQPGIKVLLIDVRTREEFEREHIRADAVLCLEPSVLLRENVSAASIEDSLNVGPREEWVLFANREKFDRIAIYDAVSTTFAPPLAALVRAIYETAFRKILKNVPMLLVGGISAWRTEVGEDQLVRRSESGGRSTREEVLYSPEPHSAQSPMVLSSVASPPMSPTVTSPDTGRFWQPPTRPVDKGPQAVRNEDRAKYNNVDLYNGPRSPVVMPEVNGYQSPPESSRLARRPAMSRPGSISASPSTYTRNISENIGNQIPQSMTNGSSSIQYPQFPKTISPATSGSSSFTPSSGTYGFVSPPPQASINPSSLSRRRSDYIDQSQEALSGLAARASIDYPELSSKHILRPPPAAAASALERQDNRPRLAQHGHSFSTPQAEASPKPPTIQSDYPVTYWLDSQIATSGLKNLGNTCYMNATIQCLSATVPFARFFTDGRWKSAINMVNPLGTKGNLAYAFASILHEMWHGELPYLSPIQFRRSICMHASQFGGSDQHDSQEFLSFLLDGLHEDLNRILQKPAFEPTAEHEAELEKLPQQIASEREWSIYRMRNDSLIVDFFQGQFRNRLECLTCHKTSTTYNSFMYLTLPVPTGKGSSKVSLHQCLDAFVKEEVMEKTDAWHCPSCKTLRRATKLLSLSRLPPVLLIHLKRFSFKGPFTDKIETFVDFPLKGLDLTNYMPPPLPPGVSKQQLNGGHPMSVDDPRSQAPPYKYDLYGVTNHFGSLNTGHYTAFIASRGGWLYCDDSRVQHSDAKEVVGRPAYVLFYKRTKA